MAFRMGYDAWHRGPSCPCVVVPRQVCPQISGTVHTTELPSQLGTDSQITHNFSNQNFRKFPGFPAASTGTILAIFFFLAKFDKKPLAMDSQNCSLLVQSHLFGSNPFHGLIGKWDHPTPPLAVSSGQRCRAARPGIPWCSLVLEDWRLPSKSPKQKGTYIMEHMGQECAGSLARRGLDLISHNCGKMWPYVASCSCHHCWSSSSQEGAYMTPQPHDFAKLC